MTLVLMALIPQAAGAQSGTPEERLAQVGIEFPPAPDPVANYVNGVQSGNPIFLAG